MNIVSIIKSLRPHVLFLTIIIALTIFAWHKILFQLPMGEGFFYFNHRILIHENVSTWKLVFLESIKGARFLFEILIFLFRDNLFFYQLFQLIILILLYISFYFFIFRLSRNKIIAFLATIFLSVHFKGSFQMYAIGAPFFYQRVPYFIPLFFSFIYFDIFLEKHKKKYYFISLALFVITVFLSQYIIFFLAFLPAYYFGRMFAAADKKAIFRFIKLLIPYFFIPGLLLIADAIFRESLVESPEPSRMLSAGFGGIVTQIAHQLTLLLTPIPLVDLLIKYSNLPYVIFLEKIYTLVVIVFVLLYVYVYKKEKTFRNILTASLLALFATFFLNLFMRWSEVANLRVPNRYFFVPSFSLSIIWAVLIYSMLKLEMKIVKLFIGVIILAYIWTNIALIWAKIDKEYYEHIASKNILRYIKETSSGFKEDSVIITPSIIGYYGSNFSNLFYGKKNTKFMPIFSPEVKLYASHFDPSKDYIFLYDYDRGQVINLTKQYKDILILQKQITRKLR